MVPTLMSCSSKETSAWRGVPSAWRLLWLCSALMVLNGLRQIRVPEWQQGALLQIKSKETEPQSTESDGQYQIEPTGHRARSEFRPRHPEKIHEPHEDQPQGYLGKNLSPALQVLRKQQEKGNKEVEDDHDDGDDAPFAI